MGGHSVTMINGKMDSLHQKYILRKVNKLAQEELKALLSDTFSNVSEALIVDAGKCHDAAQQRLYFDALCELYGKKESLATDYNRHFAHYFYCTIKPQGWDSGEIAGERDSDELLTLSEEESQHAEQLVSGFHSIDEVLLARLTRQFIVITGSQPATEQLPVGVHNLVMAFRDTLTGVRAPLQVKKSYYQHWQQQLSIGITPLWETLAKYIDSELCKGSAANVSADDNTSTNRDPSFVPALIKHLQQQHGGHEQALQVKIKKATQRVDEVLEHQSKGKRLVAPVSTLLHGPWRSLLISIWVEEGEQSIRWQIAQQVTTELLWSIQPKTSQQQRSALVKRLPQLLRALRLSLEDITWQEVDSEKLFDDLEQLHLGNLRGSGRNESL